MVEVQSNKRKAPISSQARKLFLVGLILILFIFWLLNTPPGLLGKTDAEIAKLTNLTESEVSKYRYEVYKQN